MGRQQKIPTPQVGDWVVIAHHLVDPEMWWISRVEWAQEDQYLVRDTKGWHPTKEPCLMVASESCLAFGSQDDCRKLIMDARRIKDQHISAIRNANVALQEAQNAAREAVRALVDQGNKRLHGDVEMVEP